MKSAFTFVIVGTALLCGACSNPVSPSAQPGSAEQRGPSQAPGSQGAGALSQSAMSVPLRGTFEGTQTVTPLPQGMAMVDGRATGHGTLLGGFDVEFPHTVNFATASGVGTYTFTAANGDRLTATFTGQAQVGPVTSIVEQATITGGTGRFGGATGSFTARRLFNPATGMTTGTFEGTISAPGANHP